MNEQKNNGRGIFYGVIGIATLVVAIIGATFAYFTATASNNNIITGNMATINFGLTVTKMTKVDEDKGGMIPMSNSMVEAAVSNPTSDNKGGPCVDNNGNAVCQIYKVTVSNTGTASLFLDGYISLTGGSGDPSDINDDEDASTTWAGVTVTNSTSMRWAQVFVSGDVYTTAGQTTTGVGKSTNTGAIEDGISKAWASIDAKDTTKEVDDGEDEKTTVAVIDSHNVANIKTAFTDVTAKGMRAGTEYDVINRNYVRLSDHTAGAGYDRNADITSALVFNQYLDAKGGTNPSQDLYFVVWLTESGHNQTATNTGAGTPENSGLDFFSGEVVFNSAQGSEVTATFSGFVAVRSDQASA